MDWKAAASYDFNIKPIGWNFRWKYTC